MYTIEIPATVHQIMEKFYRLRMWNEKDHTSLGECFRKLFYFIYHGSFAFSIAVGALTTEDDDERVFLTVSSVVVFVMAYRMWIILWRKNEFLLLLHEIGTHSTNDQNEYIRNKNKLDGFMKFVRYFMLVYAIGCIFGVVVFPNANQKRLLFNIALPFDWKNGYIAFWTAATFVAGGFFFAFVSTFMTKLIWYLMLSISFEYKILGNQLKCMGMISKGSSPHLKVSLAAQQQLFFEDFIVAIKLYDKVNRALEEFASYLGNLFLVQAATGSVCICGSVYTLAFSAHENKMEDVLYCLLLAYSVFDIFMVMYLGNEIMLSSDELSHCLYESNWIEQTESCKKCIIILLERLRRPQQLIVGKLYPFNLLTFTSIVKGAYSMFNLLQNVR